MRSGSGVLVEDFVYSGTLSIINPYSPVYHVVESDTGGMIPQSLKAVLSQWGTGVEAELDRPKVLGVSSIGAWSTFRTPQITQLLFYRFCTSTLLEQILPELFSLLRGGRRSTSCAATTTFSYLRTTPTTTYSLEIRTPDLPVSCP